MKARFPTFLPFALLCVALLVGLYARFYALGRSPLAIDEYYLAQAITNILESGLPRFECGGLYTRGLLQQYLTAALNLIGLDMHVALRLITVLTNIAAMPAAYWLGNRVGGRYAGIVVCILLSVSIWEIEMARFGRMYAPFHAVFAWYCVALTNAYFGSRRSFYWAIALGTLGVFVYEGAALLLCTSFIPLLAGRIQGIKNWIAAAGTFAAGSWYIVHDFRGSNAEPKLPDNFDAESPHGWNLPIDEPLVQAGSIWQTPYEALLLLAAVICSILLVATILRSRPIHRQSDWLAYFWLGAVIWLAAGGLFGLVAMLTVPLVVWGWLDYRRLNRTAILIVAGWLSFSFVAWVGMLFATTSGGTGERAIESLYSLLAYPSIYSEVIYRWFRSLPVLTFVAAVSISAYLFVQIRSKKRSETFDIFCFLLGLVLVLGVAVAILAQPYSSLRYTYFLHPLVMVLVVASWLGLASRITQRTSMQAVMTFGAAFLLMLGSADYSVSHAFGVGTPDIIYRTKMDKWETDRVYRRWDYRSPAEYVNAHAAPSDRVMTTSFSVPYYLDNLSYFYVDSRGKEYATVASCRGNRERWTSAPLVSSPADFLDMIEPVDGNDTWLIIRAPAQPEASHVEQRIAEQFNKQTLYSSADGRLIVIRIPARNSDTGKAQ